MKRRVVVWCAFVITVSLLLFHQRFVLPAKPSATTPKAVPYRSRLYTPGRLLVKFKPEIKYPTADARAHTLINAHEMLDFHPLLSHARDRATASQDHIGLSRIVVLAVPPQTDVEALAVQVQKNPIVEYAEPDYLIPFDAVPNDSLFSRQQYLPQIKAPAAWDIARGDSSVVIAIIDSGTDWQH